MLTTATAAVTIIAHFAAAQAAIATAAAPPVATIAAPIAIPMQIPTQSATKPPQKLFGFLQSKHSETFLSSTFSIGCVLLPLITVHFLRETPNLRGTPHVILEHTMQVPCLI